MEDVAFDPSELASQLVPALRIGGIQGLETVGYGENLVAEGRQALDVLLPFNDAERFFLDLLLDEGKIDARLLTPDEVLQGRIHSQPLLEWKAQNVWRHKGILSD